MTHVFYEVKYAYQIEELDYIENINDTLSILLESIYVNNILIDWN
jgi:hypothetical protein